MNFYMDITVQLPFGLNGLVRFCQISIVPRLANVGTPCVMLRSAVNYEDNFESCVCVLHITSFRLTSFSLPCKPILLLTAATVGSFLITQKTRESTFLTRIFTIKSAFFCFQQIFFIHRSKALSYQLWIFTLFTLRKEKYASSR